MPAAINALWKRLPSLAYVLILGLGMPTTLLGQDSAPKAGELQRPAQVQASTVNSGTRSTSEDGLLLLGAADLLDISVYNVPELTTKARIDSNGEINLPLINNVRVAGLTSEGAEKVIEKRLAEDGFVKNPHVTVFVNQSVSQFASVLGEVTRPGVYAIAGEQRLFDLISSAGGLTEKAGRSISVTHRSQPEAPTTVAISRSLAEHPESNIRIIAGDTIIVQKADVVYVVGDVGRPSGMLMESGGLTVLQAIALAGGTTRTAKLTGARIIRKGPNGISETPVQLKKILEAKAPDLPMQPDDILFVPTSAGKAFAGHTLQAALQAAAAASVITAIP
ncbi:MAG TPA: polysaccharide biosynthesis/export family protein [Terriglobales bacterium]|nr:polysaccharide biosynthesis/export family protein [Terriglobales bacterium]